MTVWHHCYCIASLLHGSFEKPVRNLLIFSINLIRMEESANSLLGLCVFKVLWIFMKNVVKVHSHFKLFFRLLLSVRNQSVQQTYLVPESKPIQFLNELEQTLITAPIKIILSTLQHVNHRSMSNLTRISKHPELMVSALL